MLWNVDECGATELLGFELAWLPKGLPPQIRQFQRGSRVGLEVETLVGSIPLTNGDTLQIRPKIGSANFIRMLVEAELSDDLITRPSESHVAYEFTEEATLGSLVVRPYMRALLEVEANSFRFGWKKVRRAGEAASGELLVLPTALRLLSRANEPFVYDRSERYLDVPENLTLAAAARCVLQRHSRLLARSDKDFLTHFAARFRVELLNEKVLNQIKDKLAAGSYDGARGYYAPALRLALVLLSESGFKQGSTEELRAEAVLFNSATVFEAYVRQKLRQRYQRLGFNVRKGFFPPLALFKDGSVRLEPDVIISKNDEIRVAADVKYKAEGVSSSDAYQAHAYAQRAGLSFFVFFSADEAKEQVQVTQKESHLGLTAFDIRLPIGNLDRAGAVLHKLERLVPPFRPH